MGVEAAAREAERVWLEAAAAFETRAVRAGFSDEDQLRTLVASCHAVVSSAPPNLLQVYDQFDETDLAEEVARLRVAKADRPLIEASTGGEAGLWRLAALLRMLDQDLHLVAEGPILDPEKRWSCEANDVYVIPTRRFAVKGARRIQSFARRGLLPHRIVPRRAGGVAVRLTLAPDLSPSINSLGSRAYGAALFPDWSYKMEKRPGRRFLLERVDCREGIPTLIEQQLDRFLDAGCAVALWPELMVDGDALDLIADRLAKEVARRKPDFAVAGSWHVSDGSLIRNRATVLDGRGEVLLTFDKMRAFQIEQHFEDIAAGEAIEILVYDRQLVAFAICKDFCDKAKATPARLLDVDLVIVPSMGETNTIRAHMSVADDMRVSCGARAFVVQQNLPDKSLPTGFVAAMPAKPLDASLADLAMEESFTVFHYPAEEASNAATASGTL